MVEGKGGGAAPLVDSIGGEVRLPQGVIRRGVVRDGDRGINQDPVVVLVRDEEPGTVRINPGGQVKGLGADPDALVDLGTGEGGLAHHHVGGSVIGDRHAVEDEHPVVVLVGNEKPGPVAVGVRQKAETAERCRTSPALTRLAAPATSAGALLSEGVVINQDPAVAVGNDDMDPVPFDIIGLGQDH